MKYEVSEEQIEALAEELGASDVERIRDIIGTPAMQDILRATAEQAYAAAARNAGVYMMSRDNPHRRPSDG